MRSLTPVGSWLAAATALAACGTGLHNPKVLRAPSAGARQAFARLHAEPDRLIPGNARVFASLLRSLRGYPVVINVWGSWCPGCVFEFPAFQHAARRYGGRVAFVGVDVSDNENDARAFLTKLPVPYPSYTDPDTSIAQSLFASGYYPQTLYVDRKGKVVFDHAGSYMSTAALERDIERYALG